MQSNEDFFSASFNTVVNLQEMIQNLQKAKLAILKASAVDRNCNDADLIIPVLEDLLSELRSIKLGVNPSKLQQEKISKLFEALGVLMLPYLGDSDT